MARRTSRREFLRSASVVAAGVFGAPFVATAANKGEKLKMAVIGAGGQGGSGMGTARSEHLVAVCDVDLGKRAAKNVENARKQFPQLKAYTDYREMFDKHKDLEGVWVATPDHSHFPASIRALEAGAGVYCEKPLTHTIWEARKLREVAAAKKLATQMGNQGHSGESIRRIVEYLRAGTLGEVATLHCVSNRSFGAKSRPPSKPVPEGLDWQSWLGPAPYRDYHDGLHPFSWRGWLDFGTGSIGDMGCHTIDGAVWGLKLYEAETIEVVAEDGGVNQEGFTGHARIVYRFPARGALPPVTMTWWNGGGQHLPPRPEHLGPDGKIVTQGTHYIGTKGLMQSGSHCQSPCIFPDELRKGANVEKTLPRVPGHSGDWLRACKDPTAPAPCSNFNYSVGLTEIVLLGTVALRVGAGTKLVYDMKQGRFTNHAGANAFLKRKPRKGWEFGYDA